MQILNDLLPDSTTMRLDDFTVDADACGILLEISATQLTAACPVCSRPARRIHSRYCRTITDLPWAGKAVRINLNVRRFFCDSPDCERVIFTERMPVAVAPWARRTKRLAASQQQVGLVAGGAGGARLAATLAMPAGIDLMLKLVRSTPVPEQPTPRVLGVDDWAQRKGFTYGTILVDMERGSVVDLLADRTADTFAAWFVSHPGVEIVSRDRAEAYAQGARQGAPSAMQVADRFHLLKNLADALAKILQQYHQAIAKEFTRPPTSAVPISTDNVAVSRNEDGATGSLRARSLAQAPTDQSPADSRRQQRAETAFALHQQGWTGKDIAHHLGMHPKTVRRYLHATLPMPPLKRTRERMLDPYMPYLLERWNAGCHNAAQLLRELQDRGFAGRYTVVCAFVRQLRRLSQLPERSRKRGGTKLDSEQTRRPPTPRSLTWLVVRKPHTLTDEERQIVFKLRALHPQLELSVQLAQDFAAMVRQRQASRLDSWLVQAAQSNSLVWRNFARSLEHDRAAVLAALETKWSNGPTEGHINRLKCLKRQMYGRARLDLLRLRMLAAS